MASQHLLHSLAHSAMLTECMELQFIKESVVRGGRHHVYKVVWRHVIGQLLPVLAEPANCHDKRVVAVYRDKEIVDHAPRELTLARFARELA